MMSRFLLIAAQALGIVLAATAMTGAAPPSARDPDWPCQQIKVPRLSLASVWSGPPVDDRQVDWRQDPQVADLVQIMAQRRVPVEQAQDRVRTFAMQAGDQKQPKLLQALGGAFTVLDA